MPRTRREKCSNSIYHICIRGNNRQEIFLDDQDRTEYLNRIKRYTQKYRVWILGYCLMSNHVHLLIYDNNQDISKFMQGVSLSYAIYFNRKYNRIGHLFQERFNSIIVKNENYFLYVSRYIHLNPVKAGIVSRARLYKWSSYRAYMHGGNRLVKCNLLLSILGKRGSNRIKLYQEYVENEILDEEMEEAALESDDGFVASRCGLKVMTADQVRETLKAVISAHIDFAEWDEIKSSQNYDQIIVYCLSLFGRQSYKEIGQIMNVAVHKVYCMIWKFIDRVLKDDRILNQINLIIEDMNNKIIKSE